MTDADKLRFEGKPLNALGFTNTDGFHDELQRFASQDVTITGLGRIEKIEIQKIEPRHRR